MSLEHRLKSRLARFVDRTLEMQAFCRLLDVSDSPIMVVWGDNGFGKSYLLSRMVYECIQRKIWQSRVEFTGVGNGKYSEIMHTILAGLGVEGGAYLADFNAMTGHFEVELRVTYEGGPFSVAQGMKTKDSSIGDMAAIMLKDNVMLLPDPQMTVLEGERRSKLTDCFVKLLGAATKVRQLVIFFDDIEKMSPDTAEWLTGELLFAVDNDWLPNVRFVLCGERKPELGEWSSYIEEERLEAHLEPLGREHIIEYLARCGVEEGNRGPVADSILSRTRGKASEVAAWAERFVRLQRSREQAHEQPAG